MCVCVCVSDGWRLPCIITHGFCNDGVSDREQVGDLHPVLHLRPQTVPIDFHSQECIIMKSSLHDAYCVQHDKPMVIVEADGNQIPIMPD